MGCVLIVGEFEIGTASALDVLGERISPFVSRRQKHIYADKCLYKFRCLFCEVAYCKFFCVLLKFLIFVFTLHLFYGSFLISPGEGVVPLALLVNNIEWIFINWRSSRIISLFVFQSRIYMLINYIVTQIFLIFLTKSLYRVFIPICFFNIFIVTNYIEQIIRLAQLL